MCYDIAIYRKGSIAMKILEACRQNPKYAQGAFLLFAFVFFTAWALAQPFNAGPDEYMRYQIPEFIYKYGELPHGGDPRIRNPIWGISYGFFPILSYIIAAVFMKITSFFTQDGTALLMSARMVSVLFGTGTVYFLMKTGNRIFQKGSKWLFICLAALLPEAVFITSYVNNDAMAVFSTAFIVYMWVRGIDTDWDKKSCIGLAIAMSFCVLSYYNAYGYLLCSAVLFTCTSLLCPKKGKTKEMYRIWFKKALLMLLIVFCLTGWWFIRNAVIYDGDFLGMTTNNAFAEQYAEPEHKPSLTPTPFKGGQSVFGMLLSNWSVMVFKSFIGVFGYMNVFLSPVIYWMYFAIFLVGILGCLLQVRRLLSIRQDGQWRAEGFFHWIMLLALIISNGLNIYHSYMVDYQPQGRYSLPMLVPCMYFLTIGISHIANMVPIPEKYRRWMLYLLTILVAAVAVYAFVRVIVPVYVLDVPSVIPPGTQAEAPQL